MSNENEEIKEIVGPKIYYINKNKKQHYIMDPIK